MVDRDNKADETILGSDVMTTVENETAGWPSIMRGDGRNMDIDCMRERNYLIMPPEQRNATLKKRRC